MARGSGLDWLSPIAGQLPQVSRSVPAGGRFIRQVPPTPLVPVTLDAGLGAVWCKLEFMNPDNAEAHRMFTGPEILAQMECGCVDAVASGVGTGGTLLGLWEAFDDAGCGARAYAAIPCEGAAFRDNAECSSLAFSKEVPGVADCLSALYRVFAGLREED